MSSSSSSGESHVLGGSQLRPTTTADLKQLIDFLRAEGVERFKYFDFELVLGAPTLKIEPEALPQPSYPERKGRDGLTPTQQIEFYGRVVDTEE